MKLGAAALSELRDLIGTLNVEDLSFNLDIAVKDDTEVIGYIRRDPDENGVGYYFVPNR